MTASAWRVSWEWAAWSQAVVLAAPMGCTVRLRVRASNARSAARAAVAATERAGRRLGLPLETVLRSVLRGRDRVLPAGAAGRTAALRRS